MTRIEAFYQALKSGVSPTPAFTPPEERIQMIHYSWVQPILNTFPQELQNLFLTSLPEKMQVKLGIEPKKMAPLIRRYFINQLLHRLEEGQILPPSYLPESPLTNYTNLQLLNLIDTMGLYDLSDSLRKIIDRRLIDHINRNLDPSKKAFLQKLLQKRSELTAPDLDLKKWDGNMKELKKQLHQRGIIRLGHALSEQNNDLVWHLVHTLDQGRGNLLLNSVKKSVPQNIQKALHNQLLTAMDVIS